MKTLGDFKRFVAAVRQMYARAISNEIKNTGLESTSFKRDLERDLALFNERAKKVIDAVGDVADNTQLMGETLDEAKHMLLIGH